MSIPDIVHRYPATVVRVVDGDTLDLDIDVGFRLRSVQRVRLLGYNAPELHGAEAPLGKVSAEHLRALLPLGVRVVIETEKGDAFGRWLAAVYVQTGMPDRPAFDLVAYLVEAGYGVRWDGRGERPSFLPIAPLPSGAHTTSAPPQA